MRLIFDETIAGRAECTSRFGHVDFGEYGNRMSVEETRSTAGTAWAGCESKLVAVVSRLLYHGEKTVGDRILGLERYAPSLRFASPGWPQTRRNLFSRSFLAYGTGSSRSVIPVTDWAAFPVPLGIGFVGPFLTPECSLAVKVVPLSQVVRIEPRNSL